MKRPLTRHPSPALWAGLAVAVILLGWLGYRLLPIMTPFLAALLLTYICLPAQKWLCAHRVNANLAARAQKRPPAAALTPQTSPAESTEPTAPAEPAPAG